MNYTVFTDEIKVKGSGENTKLTTYIYDYTNQLEYTLRPLIVICPGGGYSFTSDREAEILGMQFMAMGCNAAVLRYTCAPEAVFPVALCELAKSVKLIREHAKEWHVDPEKIVVEGCSAGGHLAASLGVFWDRDFLTEALDLPNDKKELIKPNGMLLCYPVITSGKFAHRGSFDMVLGEKSNDSDMLELLSLENQVSANTPKTFLWHTYTDGSVPVENSLMFAMALRKFNVNLEMHIYPCGGHGLSLANKLTAGPRHEATQEECTSWIGLARTWINNL